MHLVGGACPSLHLVHLVVAVLEEVPEEGEHLLWALVVHVSDASHTLREGLGAEEAQCKLLYWCVHTMAWCFTPPVYTHH